LSSEGADEDPELEEADGSPKGLPELDGLPELVGVNEFAEPTVTTLVGRKTAEIELKSLNKSFEFLRN
jgi:hypothetical protein